MPEDAERPFHLYVPICKSVEADDGSIVHHGLATDESLDLEDDEIPTDYFQKSLPFLNQWGKFNWDHGSTEVGDVFEARIVTPDEARELIGPEAKVVNKGLYVRGSAYPLVDTEIAPSDLKRTHHALRSGAKLGYSLQGIQQRRGGKIAGAMATKVAITPQPVNLNTVCVLAKSLREAFADIPEGEGEEGPVPVEVVYPAVVGELEVLRRSLGAAEAVTIEVSPEFGAAMEQRQAAAEGMVTLSADLWNTLLRKAMEAGSGPGVGSVGGRSLGRESLGRRLHTPILGGRDLAGKKRPKKRGLKKGRRAAHPRKLASGKVAQIPETSTKVTKKQGRIRMWPYAKNEMDINACKKAAAKLRASGDYRRVSIRKTRVDYGKDGPNTQFGRVYVNRDE
jgi:hypothetical protein